MRLHGYCTGCRRFRQVRVSGHDLAMLAARHITQGVCDDCAMTSSDLLRESLGRYGADLARRVEWLRNHPAREAPRALELLRNGRAA